MHSARSRTVQQQLQLQLTPLKHDFSPNGEAKPLYLPPLFVEAARIDLQPYGFEIIIDYHIPFHDEIAKTLEFLQQDAPLQADLHFMHMGIEQKEADSFDLKGFVALPYKRHFKQLNYTQVKKTYLSQFQTYFRLTIVDPAQYFWKKTHTLQAFNDKSYKAAFNSLNAAYTTHITLQFDEDFSAIGETQRPLIAIAPADDQCPMSLYDFILNTIRAYQGYFLYDYQKQHYCICHKSSVAWDQEPEALGNMTHIIALTQCHQPQASAMMAYNLYTPPAEAESENEDDNAENEASEDDNEAGAKPYKGWQQTQTYLARDSEAEKAYEQAAQQQFEQRRPISTWRLQLNGYPIKNHIQPGTLWTFNQEAWQYLGLPEDSHRQIVTATMHLTAKPRDYQPSIQVNTAKLFDDKDHESYTTIHYAFDTQLTLTLIDPETSPQAFYPKLQPLAYPFEVDAIIVDPDHVDDETPYFGYRIDPLEKQSNYCLMPQQQGYHYYAMFPAAIMGDAPKKTYFQVMTIPKFTEHAWLPFRHNTSVKIQVYQEYAVIVGINEYSIPKIEDIQKDTKSQEQMLNFGPQQEGSLSYLTDSDGKNTFALSQKPDSGPQKSITINDSSITFSVKTDDEKEAQ